MYSTMVMSKATRVYFRPQSAQDRHLDFLDMVTK
jgi:hypothetical protein